MRSFFLGILACGAVGVAGAQQATTTAVEHVRLIDGTGKPPRADQTVLVSGGMIQAIGPASLKMPAGARVVDAHGLTMMPGLINAHGHLALIEAGEQSASNYTLPNVLAELRQYEHFGVTSMLSLGLNRDLIYAVRRQQGAGMMDGATVYTADHGIGVEGGFPPVKHADDQLDLPATPDDARKAVDAAAARGANWIKIWVDDAYGTRPKMKPEIYQAVIAEAHSKHVPVAAHIFYLQDAKALVAAGVDMLAHSVRDKPVDDELIRAMKARGTWYLPTLTVDESFFLFADHPELLDDPMVERALSPEELKTLRSPDYRKKVADDPNTARHRADHAMAEKNLLRMYRAGVRVGFGTDSGATPTRLPGWAEHRELQMMVEAGLTPGEALACATGHNAQVLGIDKIDGTLVAGHKADFVLVQGDPATRISDTEKLVSVWHNGWEGKPWATHATGAEGTGQ